jgi:transposase InsO family protein
VTAAEVYALLHGHVREFGQARVDRYRAEAGLRIRKMKGETNALLRWIAENRARIEEDVAWAEARSELLTVLEAQKGIFKAVQDALGTHVRMGGYQGTTPYTEVSAPGYNVNVGTDYVSAKTGIRVSITIRTSPKDKPVYFPWEPTPEQVKRGTAYWDNERNYWHRPDKDDERAARDKQPLSEIAFFVPVVIPPFGGGAYNAPTTLTDAQFHAEVAADKYGHLYRDWSRRDEEGEVLKVSDEVARGRAREERVKRGAADNASETRRLSVPMLESGEATFDVNFIHQPSLHGTALRRIVPGVTLETLADTIYSMVGVGFPASPYFHG